MILSFPIDAWLLLLVAVGLGLGLEIVFYRRHRRATPRDGRRPARDPPTAGDGA